MPHTWQGLVLPGFGHLAVLIDGSQRFSVVRDAMPAYLVSHDWHDWFQHPDPHGGYDLLPCFWEAAAVVGDCADLNDVIGTAVIADVPVLRNLGSTAVTKDNSSAVENHPFWLSGIDGGASLVPIPGKH
jgi:hypothetical protein